MKLLRSTFLAFYLTSNNNNVSAFSSQLSTKSLSSRTPSTTPSTKLSMSIELHETPKMQLSEEEILKESMFLQVVREVNMAKEYMDYLIEESGADGEEVVAKEDTEVAASDDIELFGGSGGDSPSTSSTPEAPIIYNPSLRTNLGSTILLSGTTDSNLLSILNNNFFGQDLVPNFNFEQIKCLVNDVKQTKKSAISREARYGGLLDKLVIEEASNSKSSLPTKDELEGVTSWIVQLTLGDSTKDELETIATLAKESVDLKNVVVLIDGMASTKNVVGGWDSVVEASGTNSDNFSCTLLAVGELYDGGKDGGYYHIGSLDTVDSISADTIDAPKLSKKKAYQLLAHALSLDSTVNMSLTAFEYPVVALEAVTVPYAEGEFVKRDDEGNEKDDEYKNVKMEGRMIQAMREMGFTPVNELDVLVGKGIESFKEYIANPPNKKNAFTPATKTAQDEADEKILAQIEADIAERKAIQEVQDAEQKKIDIEGIAKEWVTREYTLRMLAGDIEDSVSEKDFMISVWDEALKEGAKAYEYIRSDEFAKQKKEKKAVANVEDKLFWDGMPDDMRKMREKMIEKVKKQYMDLLSEEELERIILSES